MKLYTSVEFSENTVCSKVLYFYETIFQYVFAAASSLKFERPPMNLHKLPPGMTAVQFVKDWQCKTLSDGASVTGKPEGDFAKEKHFNNPKPSRSVDLKGYLFEEKKYETTGSNIAAASQAVGMERNLKQAYGKNISQNATNNNPMYSLKRVPVKRAYEKVDKSLSCKQMKKSLEYKVFNKSHRSSSRSPIEEQKENLMRLSDLLIQKVDQVSPNTSVKLLCDCCQALNSKPSFRLVACLHH